MKFASLFYLILYGATGLTAQNDRHTTAVDSAYVLHIHQSGSPIQLDGVLDEAAWQTAATTRTFRKQFPVDTGLAKLQTTVQLTFDAKFLYVAAVCYEPRADYTVQSLKRDFPPGTSDALNIVLDPSKDGLNGFVFSVNPLNVQREGLIDNGSNQSFDWDNKWSSAVLNQDDRWVIEVAIPFKTLRYTVAATENTWRINFVRTYLKDWEVSTWHPVAQQYAPNNLAFTGILVWAEPPPKPGASVAFIPYVIGSYGLDYRRDPQSLEVADRPTTWKGNAGGDMKIAVTPSLNLDLTINPDFSQVEVDRQVTNLSRFELFFPERRQFFLENRDLFASFGFPTTRPFFSRRIGIGFNPVQGRGETVPILAGARLSGKLNDQWRIGLLNMQTRRVDWDSTRVLPAANFTVATVSKKMFERSALSAVLVNKQQFVGPLSEQQRAGIQPWNRVAGLEYNLYSKDNRWEGEWYYHRSFAPDPARRGQTAASFLGYRDRHLNGNLGYLLVDSNYTAEVGFVPRKGYQEFYPGIGWTFYPQQSAINTLEVGAAGSLSRSLRFKETDRQLNAYVNVNFRDQSGLGAGYYNNFTYLFDPFDPTNLYADGTAPLPIGGYTYSGLQAEYYSSSSHNLQGSLQLAAGQFFNGKARSVGGELSYRWQPWGTFAVSGSYDRIRLPQPYASADFWLIGSRAELAFSRSVFASAFFQYNTQVNNFNINTRLQWRFAPVSDLFLVYTDNSFAEPIAQTRVRFFAPKNKALVLKIVYWLNV